nr:ribonuclease H-like domain-containing protein [Tanacetum cinerariifolium]
MSDPNWVDAMNNEIEALNKNSTWTIYDLCIARNPIRSKWIWKIKYRASDEIKRYKARLVAKGFSQREVYQIDVYNAFLYGDLVEDVYMTLPDGYNNKDKSKVFKLNKSLYDLKQAPRQWNAKLTTALAEHGHEQSKFDYSLYTKHRGDKFIALLVYVDDIVITENVYQIDVYNALLYGDLVKDVYMTLPDGYNNKDKSKVCKLNKSLYDLKQAPRQWNAKLTTALAEHGHEQSKFDYSLYTKHRGDKFIALLVYVDDIVITENGLRVLRYLKGSPCHGIQFYKHSDLRLKAYADADWAKCPKTRRPVTGFCVFLGKTLVSWKSKNKPLFLKVLLKQNTKLGVVQHRLCCKNLGMLDVFAGELGGKDLERKNYSWKKKGQAHQPKGGC